MNGNASTPRILAGLGLALLALACGSSRGGGEHADSSPRASAPQKHGAPPIIRGTTVDAASGAPLGGVLVQGPGGVQTTSDASGQFELRGLEIGATGPLVASTEDGRAGKNLLRPLQGGPLEVVLFVR